MLDLNDFADEYAEARKAVEEALQRAKETPHSDRWVVGHAGMHRLFAAFPVLLRTIDYQAAVMNELLTERERAGEVAMSPGEPEAKYSPV